MADTAARLADDVIPKVPVRRRGRDAGCPAPPAQSPACGTTAPEDFGLATLPVRSRDLVTEPLFQREDVLIFSLGHPLGDRSYVALRTVAKEPLLALEHGSKSRELLEDAFKRAELQPEVTMDFGSLEVIKQFVEIGFGVAIVPRAAIRRELEDGRLAAVAVRGLERRTVGIIHRRGRVVSRAADELSALIKTQLAGTTM